MTDRPRHNASPTGPHISVVPTVPLSTTEQAPRSRLTRGRAFAIAWVTFGVFYSLQSYTFNLSVGRSQEWSTFVGFELLFIATLALPTPLILALGRRWPVVGPGRGTRIARHVAMALFLAFTQRFVFEVVQRTIRATAETPFTWTRAAQATLGSFETGVFLYLIVLLGMHFWDYYERWGEERVRAAHLRADLSTAQLEALRTQVQPHFLFNTLNAISVLIDENPQSARVMVGHLGDFLRATLAESGRQEIPLRRELELLGHYLDIEQTRFGDRLEVTTIVTPEALEAEVPALLLQPLVENAIRHGISKRPGPGRVEIEGTIRDSVLVLTVRDRTLPTAGASLESATNGGPPDAVPAVEGRVATQGTAAHPPLRTVLPTEGLGIGLRNTQARLRELYGDAQGFRFESIREAGREVGAEVVVSIGRSSRG